MSDFPVIGIVGPPASGKTQVASDLVDLGSIRVRMGNVVWKEVVERGLEVNEENVGKVGNQIRGEGGMGAVAKHCVPIVRKKGKNSKAVVVDGVRGIAEVDEFKKEFGENFWLLSVEASEETRYRRTKERRRGDDAQDFEAFKRKDNRESNWGMENAMEAADYRIVNEGSLQELKERTSEIFEEIMDRYED